MTAPARSALADEIAGLVMSAGMRVAVAESLTCGLVTAALGEGQQAAKWLRGGVIAYDSYVKQSVLGVSPGPVVTARCAVEMAAGAARVLGADIAVSTTGVGGPDPEEGQPAGTVHIGWSRGNEQGTEAYRFEGDPDSVLTQTVDAALRLLLTVLGAVAQEPVPGNAIR